MPFTDYLLYRLARAWPALKSGATARIGRTTGDDFHEAYSRDQFDQKVRRGLGISVEGLEVLEVGCGHGGITSFIAVAGAKRVVGIDINQEHLDYSRRFAAKIERGFGADYRLPAEFVEMNAYQMTFEPESFDLVICDNSMEHFLEPDVVLKQGARVLRKGGRLLVPSFSSIISKYGLHLKNGLKLPWANLFFSERTIVRAMQRLGKEDPKVLDDYPGLRRDPPPQRVRDLRPYGDLNDITYAAFKRMAADAGLEIEWFRPFPTPVGYLVARTPLLRRTRLVDIFSTGAAACLRKPS